MNSIEKKKINVSWGVVLGILGVYFLGGGITNASPAMEYIAQAFPDVPYSVISMVTTLPNLIVVPCSVIAGAICGTKVKMKPLILFSAVLYSLGGAVTAFWYQNIYVILACRVLFGIGIGLATPLGFAAASKMIADENDRSTVMGWGSVCQNVISMAGVVLAGYLCMIRWNYTFLVYLTGAVGLVLTAIFLPDVEREEGNGKKRALSTYRQPLSTWLFSAVLMLYMTLVYPLYVSMSSIVVQSGIGDASTTGTILIFFNLGGIAAGMFYGMLYKKLNQYIIPFSLLTAMAGFLIIYFGNSVFLLIAGTFVAGLTSVWMIPGTMAQITRHITPEGAAMASGIMMAAMNLGGYIVTPYFAVLEAVGKGAPLDLIFISAILLAVLAVVVWIGTVWKKEK